MDSWSRRRRRQCSPRACEVSSWSSWSSCYTSECGQQKRSRTVESSASCGGTECPTLDETRQCYGSSGSLDCKISSWSEWSACTTPCGISGIQSSARHRIAIEKCGGTCTSTFRKTRKCPLLSCLNGGTLEDGTCFCTKNYGGNCCENKKTNVGVVVGCTVGALFVVSVIAFLIVKYYCCGSSSVSP